jgi:hypothetical protein
MQPAPYFDVEIRPSDGRGVIDNRRRAPAEIGRRCRWLTRHPNDGFIDVYAATVPDLL